ncbi:nucleoside-diphosphate kinase [candidate division KSB1 bacterium]|nr:MAG: nucleoside-diphosphate kinase [candidate division KSB1 bacterium]
MQEQTLLIIKPDAIERHLAGKIIQKIEESGFEIGAIKKVVLTKKQAEAFYGVHRDKEFFSDLVEFMTSGPCIPMVVRGENAVHGIRELVGATDPEKAYENTIRALWGTTIRKNCVHASDCEKSAEKEICFFFDLCSIVI